MDVIPSMVSPTLMSFNVADSPACANEEHVSPSPSVVLVSIQEHIELVSNEEHVSPLPSVVPASLSPPVQVEAVPATHDSTSPIASVSPDRSDAALLMQSAEDRPGHTVGIEDPSETACCASAQACLDTLTVAANPTSVNSHSSPIGWLPAEDVLSVELASNAGAMSMVRYNGSVYSRRPRIQMTPNVHPSEPDPPMDTFLNNISKKLQVILPTPKTQKRQWWAAVTTQAPRRSRHIANLPPETDHKAATSVCRSLGFSDDELQKYTDFFSKPLNRGHVVALAKLIGKEVPSEEELRVAVSQECF